MKKLFMILDVDIPDKVYEQWERDGKKINFPPDAPLTMFDYPCYLLGLVQPANPATLDLMQDLLRHRDEYLRKSGIKLDRKKMKS